MRQLDHIIKEFGTINMLVDIQDFQGIELKAVWDDLILGIKHWNDIQRLAAVGARKWEEWMVDLVKPF